MELLNPDQRAIWQVHFIFMGLLVSTYIFKWMYPFHRLMDMCLVPTKPGITEWLRTNVFPVGDGYFVPNTNYQRTATLGKCFYTMWGVGHVVNHFCAGALVPGYFWYDFWLGVAFEIFEWYFLDCHDAIDIVSNSVGYLTGAWCRRMVFG